MEDNKITAWAVIKHGNLDWVFNTEEKAKEQNKLSNGTVVRLTGEMPRKPIERKTTAYVKWMDSPITGHEYHLFRLGIMDLARCQDKRCQHKVEICVKELPEEGEE